jgi:hypothetical protein
MRLTITILFLIIFEAVNTGFAQSSIVETPPKEFILTSKIHSTGHFPYSGSLLNNHLNIDFNLYYAKNNNGFFVFKAIDLEDFASDVNYTQVGGFRRFHVSKTITLTPYVGYIFLQTKGFLDKGSDVFVAFSPTYQSDKWKIENTTLIQSVLDPNYASTMANRLEIKYFMKPFNLSWFIWHNTTMIENAKQSLSTALVFQFPKVELAKNMPMQTSLMLQTYVSKYKPDYALAKGVVFSIIFPIELGK